MISKDDFYKKIIEFGNKLLAEKEVCLFRKFQEEQKALPINQRSNSCLISCPCSSCNLSSL